MDIDQLNPDHVIPNYRGSGKPYILYAGLLDLAHGLGIKYIETYLLQIPSPDNANTAIVHATVEMEDGTRFQGIGDASPDNVGKAVAEHLIRMAETRAKARALRDAVNPLGAGVDETDFAQGDEDSAGFASEDQVEHLSTLAAQWRGDRGVERLEARIGKDLVDLSPDEADEWIERLTPKGKPQ